jgi:hypothetical protein
MDNMEFFTKAINQLSEFSKCEGVSTILEALKALEKMSKVEDGSLISLRNQLNTVLADNNSASVNNNNNNLSFADVVYNISLGLAAFRSINDNDPVTQCEISKDNCVFVSTGHQFDIRALIQYHNGRGYRGSALNESPSSKWLLNPFTNKPFSLRDVIHIQAVAEQKGIKIQDLKTEENGVQHQSVQQQSAPSVDELFNSIGNNVDVLANLVGTFPQYRDSFYQKVSMEANFSRFVRYNAFRLAELVEVFPEHRDDFYQKINTEADFPHYSGYCVNALKELVRIFPQYRDSFYQKVSTEANFPRFVGYNALILAELVEVFPEHRDDFYQKINIETDFQHYSGGQVDSLKELIEAFPGHKDDFYQKATAKNNFPGFVRDNKNNLAKLVELFPNHATELNSQFDSLNQKRCSQENKADIPNYGYGCRLKFN